MKARVGRALRGRAAAAGLALAIGQPGALQAQAAIAPAAATGELRAQLEALLPAARIDEDDLRRALEPRRWPACRSLAIAWNGPRQRDPQAAADGGLKLIAESRCREPCDLRASLRIGGPLVAVALDREGAVLWWKRMPDVRRVYPILPPSAGDKPIDREALRLHAEGHRVGHSWFDIELPADRRIARLTLLEAGSGATARAPVVLGTVDLPVR